MSLSFFLLYALLAKLIIIKVHFNLARNICWIFLWQSAVKDCLEVPAMVWTHDPQIPNQVPWPFGHSYPTSWKVFSTQKSFWSQFIIVVEVKDKLIRAAFLFLLKLCLSLIILMKIANKVIKFSLEIVSVTQTKSSMLLANSPIWWGWTRGCKNTCMGTLWSNCSTCQSRSFLSAMQGTI